MGRSFSFRLLRGAALAASVACQACIGLSGSRPAASVERVPAQRFLFRDGGSALFYTLHKQLPSGPALPVETVLFFVSGSDCTSMQYFLPQYFRGLEGESGPIRIFVLQKRFIEARTWARDAACSSEFIKADHFSQWLADQTEFIAARLDEMRREAPVRRIVIAGVSEGGEVVPALARNLPGVTHAVIISNGGMDPLDAYRLWLAGHAGSAASHALAALQTLAPPPSDPDTVLDALGGRTWRYWSELAGLRHTENLLALSIPLWVAIGEADEA